MKAFLDCAGVALILSAVLCGLLWLEVGSDFQAADVGFASIVASIFPAWMYVMVLRRKSCPAWKLPSGFVSLFLLFWCFFSVFLAIPFVDVYLFHPGQDPTREVGSRLFMGTWLGLWFAYRQRQPKGLVQPPQESKTDS